MVLMAGQDSQTRKSAVGSLLRAVRSDALPVCCQLRREGSCVRVVRRARVPEQVVQFERVGEQVVVLTMHDPLAVGAGVVLDVLRRQRAQSRPPRLEVRLLPSYSVSMRVRF